MVARSCRFGLLPLLALYFTPFQPEAMRRRVLLCGVILIVSRFVAPKQVLSTIAPILAVWCI